MYVQNTVTIERPIEEVFEYASTPENDPTWVPASIRNQRTLPGPMRVGMTTEETVKLFGLTSRNTFEVIEYDSPTVVAYRATSGPLSGLVVRVRCEPVEGGTSLTHAVEWEPHTLYYKAILPLMTWMLPRLLASMDRTLKNLLEGETTVPSKTVEATAVIPLNPEETWDLLFGDSQRMVEAIDNVISIEDYEIRADGTPRYTMVRKLGPITMSTISDYSVFERPHRSVSQASDPNAPFGGTFYTIHEPVAGGTRLTFRMDMEAQNSLAAVMLPVVRPLFARQLQKDLNDIARAATRATRQEGHPQQDQQRRAAASVSGLLGGGLVAAGVILALHFLARRRSKGTRRRGWFVTLVANAQMASARKGGSAMRRIILALGGVAVLAAVTAALRRRSGGAAPPTPILVSESVVIERPREEVFAYLTDLQNFPEWGEVIRELRKETEGPPRVGERYTVDIAFLGRRWEQAFEVTAYEPPQRYADRNTGGPFHDEHTYTFDEVAGRTRLTVTMDMQPGGFFRITGPLLEKAVRRQVGKELGTLKDILEARD